MTWVDSRSVTRRWRSAAPATPSCSSAYLYSRAQSVMGGTSQIQKNIIAARILGTGSLTMYDLPEEIDVQADGPLRIITLNRPEELNAVNDALHSGLAQLWPRLNEDCGARAAVITGDGRAFSAGGDFDYLDELRQRRSAAPEDDQARP